MSTRPTDIPEKAVTTDLRTRARKAVEDALGVDLVPLLDAEEITVTASHTEDAADAVIRLVLASRDSTTRSDELGRWLDAGEVAGYATVADLLNAIRVRRDWLMQGVPASPSASRDSETVEQAAGFTCPGRSMPQPADAPPEGYVACYRAGHECRSTTTRTEDGRGGVSTRTVCPCCGDGHGSSYVPASLRGEQ